MEYQHFIITTDEARFLQKELLENIEEAMDHGVLLRCIRFNDKLKDTEIALTIQPNPEEYKKIHERLKNGC